LDTYNVVLYLHLLALFIGIGAASILLVCIFQFRNAQTLADAIPWGRVAGKVARAFPIAVLGLFATGAYMTSDLWTWDTGWIYVSIAGLAVVTLQGPIVAERTAHKLGEALQENGAGPLAEHARRMTRHPGLWIAEFTNVALVLGIVWNMTQKPGTGSASPPSSSPTPSAWPLRCGSRGRLRTRLSRRPSQPRSLHAVSAAG
jgi:hypothetical protein